MTLYETTGDVPLGYEVVGRGAPLIFVGGALNGIDTGLPLAQLLENDVRTLTYDRRGRGTSPDAGTWSLDAEIDDLHRMVRLLSDECGAPASIFANCSGGMLVLRYLQRYPDHTDNLIMYEPPFMVTESPLRITDQLEKDIVQLVDNGDPDSAVEQFLTRSVGFPADKVAMLRTLGKLEALRHLSPSLRYEIFVAERNHLPEDVAQNIHNPTLLFVGGDSPGWQHQSMQRLAELIPDSHLVEKRGCNHVLRPDQVWEQTLEFLTHGTVTPETIDTPAQLQSA